MRMVLPLFFIHTCECGGLCLCHGMPQILEDSLRCRFQSVLSSHNMDSRYGSRVIWFGTRCLYPLGHLGSPILPLFSIHVYHKDLDVFPGFIGVCMHTTPHPCECERNFFIKISHFSLFVFETGCNDVYEHEIYYETY